MATKPNYQFEKRQREMAKQKKKQEKAQRKGSPSPAEQAGGAKEPS
ncbi:hypothetical protein SAMN05216359_102448 [Roseateles sp. YR242]|nr:hypothetical protein [Roseateles sp. YR242]SEK62642.1 hypothetical protein SAMN05216359_102448 [Roseateles sp. YR242]